MSIALMFPGQGSQIVGMGKALADAYPACARVFEEVDAALGEKLSKIIFEGPEAELTLWRTWFTVARHVTSSRGIIGSRTRRAVFCTLHATMPQITLY